MRYLKIKGEKPVAIDKSYFTVGLGSGYDVSLPSSQSKILFSVMSDNGKFSLIPGDEKIQVNGKSVGRALELEALDRIEWKGQTAVFIDELEGASEKTAAATSPLSILRA